MPGVIEYFCYVKKLHWSELQMKENKNLLYLLWSAAIVVCVVLSVFALFFSACAKQDDGKTKAPEKSGFTESKVKSMLHRTRKKLLKQLKEEGLC